MSKKVNKNKNQSGGMKSAVKTAGVKNEKVADEEKVKKVSFPNLKDKGNAKSKNPLGMLNDIPLNVVVELGRTVLKVKDILELGVGSIVELDKLSGEPLDIIVNGEKIARGEVIVIDEDFGVRITDVILDKVANEENEQNTK